VADDSAARVPDGVSVAEAATLPMNGLTARLALDKLALRPGRTIAVTGAAGAVGGYVVQLAAADELRVIGDPNPADEDLVKSPRRRRLHRRTGSSRPAALAGGWC
jgi:NADPH:quinone reductase